MEQLYRPDQDILDELEVGMSVAEVVNLSTSEYAARLRRLNLSPQASALVKCLRRRIKNRVASQNSRRRTADHIRSLTEQLSAVRATKTDVLTQRQRLRRECQIWTDRLARLASYITETLQERGDATPLPAETLLDIHLRPPVCDPALRLSYSPRDTDNFTCDLRSLVAKSIHHMYSYDYDKEAADTVLDFRKRGHPSECESKENFADPSVEDNIKNEREEVAKALQLLAMTEPKTELETNINVFQNGYLLKSEYFYPYEYPNPKSDSKQNIYSRDDAMLKCEPTHYNVEHSLYCDEYENGIQEKQNSGPVRVRAKCVQIECEREHTVRDNGKEGSERRRKRTAKKERIVQRSCIVHTSDVQTVGKKIQNAQKQSLFDSDYTFYNEDVLKGEVLNLSLKTNEKRHHGRKQQAPRRIKYVDIEEDTVLDLKIKKSYE